MEALSPTNASKQDVLKRFIAGAHKWRRACTEADELRQLIDTEDVVGAVPAKELWSREEPLSEAIRTRLKTEITKRADLNSYMEGYVLRESQDPKTTYADFLESLAFAHDLAKDAQHDARYDVGIEVLGRFDKQTAVGLEVGYRLLACRSAGMDDANMREQSSLPDTLPDGRAYVPDYEGA